MGQTTNSVQTFFTSPMPTQLPNKWPGERKQRNNDYDPSSGFTTEDELETLSPPILEGSERDILLMPEGVVYLGSYNWVDCPNPTIVVPGSPRLWADKRMPMDVPLPPDSGDFVHQNEHRMKKPTLLPLIKAVQDLIDQGVTPKFDWSSVDFVTDRARLRMLLAWARGKSGTDRWRIDTEFVGTKTVLLSDGAPNMKRVGGGGASYGVIFEKESTRPVPGLENAPSHYRIVTYNFDGLKMVVRFEVDACLQYEAGTSGGNSREKEKASGSSSDLPGAKVTRGGSSDVPQTHLLEIKTHGPNSKLHWQTTYPQLYLSQTPNIYCAYHNGSGNFTLIKKFKFGDDRLAGPAEAAQEGFKKLRKLLGDIQLRVLEYGATRISLVYMEKTLRIYRIPQGEERLPEEALALFVG